MVLCQPTSLAKGVFYPTFTLPNYYRFEVYFTCVGIYFEEVTNIYIYNMGIAQFIYIFTFCNSFNYDRFFLILFTDFLIFNISNIISLSCIKQNYMALCFWSFFINCDMVSHGKIFMNIMLKVSNVSFYLCENLL